MPKLQMLSQTSIKDTTLTGLDHCASCFHAVNMSLFIPYTQLPVPYGAETDYEVLKLEFKPNSGMVLVHTENFTCNLPSKWDRKRDVKDLIQYWEKLPNKYLHSYWFSDEEIRWELWSSNMQLGWWSVFFNESF